jgi:hypothetical protein
MARCGPVGHLAPLLLSCRPSNEGQQMSKTSSASNTIAFPAAALRVEPPSEPPKKKKHRRSRFRSAWISFTGRIVAQFVGSAASILLAMIVVGKHQPAAVVPAATVSSPTAATQTPPVVIVLSLDGVSPDVAAVSAAIAAALREPLRPADAGRHNAKADGTAPSSHDARIARRLQPDSDLASSMAWSTNSSESPGVR